MLKLFSVTDWLFRYNLLSKNSGTFMVYGTNSKLNFLYHVALNICAVGMFRQCSA